MSNHIPSFPSIPALGTGGGGTSFTSFGKGGPQQWGATSVEPVMGSSDTIPPKILEQLIPIRQILTQLTGTVGPNQVITVGHLIASGIITGTTEAGAIIPSTPYNSNPPASPTGLVASGALANITLSWDTPSDTNISYAEVWRASTNSLAAAKLIGQAISQIFVDNVGGAATDYYWVRNVSFANIRGNFNAQAGTLGTTGTDPSYIMSLVLTQYGFTTAQIAAGAFPVTNVATLPALPSNKYPPGVCCFNSTDGILYRNVSDTWTSAVPTTSLTGVITSAQIANNTIVAGNIAANTITATQIAAGAITATQIAANTITSGQIAGNTITAGNILAATITSSQIAANTIVAGNIAAATITSAQIQAATITGDRIAAGTIVAGNIAAGAITASAIAAGAITASSLGVSTLSAIVANLGTITAGDIGGTTLHGGAFGPGFAWPAAGAGGGFHLSSNGLLLGNANTAGASYMQINSDGSLYAPAFSVSPSGVMTLNQVCVNTVNIAGQAVTFPAAAFTTASTGALTTSTVVQTVSYTSTGVRTSVQFSLGLICFSATNYPTVIVTRNGTSIFSWEAGVGPSGEQSFAATLSDVPPAGAVTYNLILTPVSASYPVSASVRSILTIELRR